MLDLLDRDIRVILLTARPQRVHELTEAWLAPLPDPLGRAHHAAVG